jgi:urease accessory protein UreE
MSIHQISQAPNDALICCSIHQRLRALLAQLQAGLHGYMTRIASCHVTPLQNLHLVGTLTKRNTTRALLHFNAEVVVKQAEVTHFERGRHLLLERPDVVAVRASDDEVIDVDPNHKLHVAVPPDVGGVFRRSPQKA